jgi:hypothetical protein
MNSVFAGRKDESAMFNVVAYGIAIDQRTGALFVADFSNHNIRTITPQGNFFYPLFCRD